MGIKEFVSQARSRIGEARVRGAHRAELREDIRRDERVAERKAFRIEAVKVATKRGIERARQPSGLGGFVAGMGRLSKGLDKIVPVKKGKATGLTMTDIISGSKKKQGKSMIDFKF